jgi:NADH:ubiquinone reductase (H+-translocating)
MNSKTNGEMHGNLNGKLPRVVIVGAGFGGLNAAKALARAQVQITVVDRKNHHTFQPLLYQVATAGLSPGEIAAPIRSILSSHKNVEVLMAEVTGFDLERHVVETPDCEIPYDYLIVAAGARHAYFGHEDWEPFAPGLKTIEDALEIRRRVLLAFELAERQVAAGAAPTPLNFVVVGAGPTGVELAGTLAEISRHALAHDYRAIDPKLAHILLLEGGPRVLPAYAEDLSRSAQEQLQHLGVEVRTSAVVTQIEPGAIHVGETRLAATVILWAAGVAASPLGRQLTASVDRAGRVLVQPDLSLPGHPEVFVIGDLAALKDENGKMLPGVAPVAMQQGDFVAKLIRHEIESSGDESKPGAPFLAPFARNGDVGPRPAFHYWDKGSLATIGRAAAVAQFGKIHISGFIAWLAWLFVHILFLIGFRNRLLVFIQWAWSYVTYERGARLITGSTYLPGWTAIDRDGHSGPDPRLDSRRLEPERLEPRPASGESAPPEIHAAVRSKG